MRKLFILIFLCISCRLVAQGDACEKIYRSPTVQAYYGEGSINLSKFCIRKLAPIIAPSGPDDEPIISSLYVTLTITKTGKVVAAELMHFHGSEERKEKLIKEFISMKGWMPAKVGNKNVCSTYYWVVACFKWDFEDGQESKFCPIR